MKINDILSYSFSAIKLRKLRAGLTTLGVVIGIAAIVALLSLGQGFQNAITEQFETGFATNTLTVTTQGFGFMQGGSDLSLFVSDTQTIDEIENVQTSMAIIQKTCYIEVGENDLIVTVIGVDLSKYADIYSSTFVAESGEIPLNPDDETIVIGKRVSDSWDNGTTINVNDAVKIVWTTRSDTGTIEDKSYTGTVAAVLSEIGGFGIGGPSDTSVYIPISLAQSFFETDEAAIIIVQLANSEEATIAAVSETIENTFEGQVQVIVPTAILNTVTATFSTMELFLAGIAGISLLVAGIGIMNITIVSLMERTREIGILKALGMKNRTTLSIFLSESAIIGLMGAVIGIASGWVLSNVVARVFSGGFFPMGQGTTTAGGITITPILTPTLLLGSLAFGIIVSVIFALYPAWRASKLKPVEALRYE